MNLQKVLVLIAGLILIVLLAPYCNEAINEGSCTGDGGRIMIHNLSGRSFCDKRPYTDNISDMGSNDYWLD